MGEIVTVPDRIAADFPWIGLAEDVQLKKSPA
jgi:hypothetical protein